MTDVGLTVNTVDALVSEALTSLYTDLQGRRDCYKREQELVSVFAFGHLAPLLLREGIDPGQLCVEGRVPQANRKRGAVSSPTRRDLDDHAHRDLVLFRRRHCTHWCGNAPYAVMEWKLSVKARTLAKAKKDYKIDLDWLQDNAHLMRVGYCVLVEWVGKLRIQCERVCNGEPHLGFPLVLASAEGSSRGAATQSPSLRSG